MKKISPYKYHGSISSCGSKSHAQRILILALISRSSLFIKNFIIEEIGTDVQHVLKVCEQLGFTYIQEPDGIQFIAPNSLLIHPESNFNIGESGFALRTLSTVLSALTDSYVIEGEKTILNRDHKGLIESLNNIGFEVNADNNKLPLKISKSESFPSTIEIDGSEGSQFISGILMRSLTSRIDTEIRIKNMTSRPYIDLTIKTIEQFNGKVNRINDSTHVIPGGQVLSTDNVTLEGDWSNMAFHIVGAALNGEIVISGLSSLSTQADKIILDVLKKFGAKIVMEKSAIIKVSSALKKPFHIDLSDAPDLFPVLAVLACGANGVSIIQGTHRLVNKESNRLQSICNMLDVFKVNYQSIAHELHINGRGRVNGGNVKTYDDHRIAMAAICAGTIADNAIIIDNEECINKSYKNYFKQMDGIF
ncbi:MAG: 3-phosphoshikimate 1-carboxyvinyltransferase [Bacteroidota bacterium]|nr:3-phosphoshikimate 1-carboxyvinyltransferase [Bacteroidota bacterium]